MEFPLYPIDSGLKSLDWSINASPERGTRPMKNVLPWPQSLFVIIPPCELGNFFEVSFRLSLQTLSSGTVPSSARRIPGLTEARIGWF